MPLNFHFKMSEFLLCEFPFSKKKKKKKDFSEIPELKKYKRDRQEPRYI